MAKIVLDRPSVTALVGKLVAAVVAQHVWVNGEGGCAWAPARAMIFGTEESVIALRRSVVKT